MTSPRPLCDAGRCNQILTAAVEARAQFAARQGAQIAGVLRRAVERANLSDKDAAAVTAALLIEMRAMASGDQGGQGRG